jgi:C-terminal processing protease CtpA/Prc
LKITRWREHDTEIWITIHSSYSTQKTAIYGRGVFPDVEILPTLKDKLEEKDPSMDWVLKDIENRKFTQ